ncbi:Pdh family protein [Megaselia abdita]
MTDALNKFRNKYPRQGLIFYKMDVANKNGLEAAYSEIFKNFGSIDIVVNIAGMFNELDVMRTITVNLGGVINSTLAAMKYMGVENDGKGGIIANMSSVVGLDPNFMMPTYCATKHGIVGFTRSLSDEFYWKKTGIKFVTLCVGVTITPMLTNFPEKLLYSEMEEGSYRLLELADKQSASDVSKCIMSILEKCENGEVFIVENKKFFPIKMDSYWKMNKGGK